MRNSRRWNTTALVVGLVVVAAAPVRAQTVTNGGFESGLTGWTTNTGFCTAAASWNVSAAAAHTGTGGLAVTNNDSCDAWVVQPLAFVAGHDYQLDFWAWATSSTDNDVIAEFGTGSQYLFGNGNGIGATGSQHVTLTLHNAPANATDLWLGTRSGTGSVYLDDVAIADVTTTPEPASLALLGTGLVALVPAARRRVRS